ncbi:hypothetical protein FEA48_11025 [Pseudomonas nitroreducens]|uniref:Uncharacterized protein n=1 Tax=Pseudomonas nitroreducens TaxID=46680 RepID=A0A5R9A7N6_PSENT|nr:hypothetical protein [Pseudomonas nitroreducens]TLP74739.1 hypothetical protein FEA48_11025 [Pseudomonas nitroreducens]
MRKVIVPLDGELGEWAKAKSDQEAVSAIQEVMLGHVREQNTRGVEAIFRRNLESFPAGHEFEVANIVGHEAWSVLGKSERISFGKQVKRRPDLFGLEFVRTSVSRHAVYRKV